MVPMGPNLLIVRPIWTRGPLNAAWSCRMVQERFPQSPLSQFPSDIKKRTNKFQRKPSLAGFAVMVQWHPRKRCPAFLVGRTQFFCEGLAQSISREFQIGVATFWLPWLVWLLRIVWMTSLLSTENQQFSQDGLSGVSWQRSGFCESSSVTSSSHSWCNI